jgi:Flp pilus assembly protein TadG
VITRLLDRLRREERGATVIEFALVAPALMLVIIGLFDLTYRLYATAILNGEVQKVARDATLQMNASTSGQAALDQRVKDAFRKVNGAVTNGDFEITRRNFTNFTNAARMEATTGPGGQCAPGFTYADINNSNSWDDGALEGQGGANDVTVYTVKVTYRSVFPFNAIFGGAVNQTITATTILRNQPYTAQGARVTGPTRDCTG